MPANSALKLEDLSARTFVPFAVRKVARARVIWLNHRYFLEQGINSLESSTQEHYCRMLVDGYGVMVPDGSNSHLLTGAASHFLADRYGGAGVSQHGGSGRSGISGPYNAKGIGRTPLASPDADWGHAHGYLPLREAIREAVAAEIANAELPHGAVPIVAVIDIGCSMQRTPSSAPDRLGVVVRPNFVRPAHFERSIGFGSAGFAGSDQHQDMLRVRENIARITDGLLQPPFDMHSFMEAVAQQIGACRALRLSQGRLLSSNITISGAMVDFGSFRAMANWRRAHGDVGEVFGDDERHVNNLAASLVFYMKKYGNCALPGAADLISTVNESTDKWFVRNCIASSIGNYAGSAANLAELFRAYYTEQQREVVKVDDPRDLRLPWIHARLVPLPSRYAQIDRQRTPAEVALLAEFESLKKYGATDCNIERFFRPRPLLNFNISNERARRLCNRLPDDDLKVRSKVSSFIYSDITKSRRSWRGLDRDLDIHAHIVTPSTEAVAGLNLQSGRAEMRIRAHIVEGNVAIFEQIYPLLCVQERAEHILDREVILNIPIRCLRRRHRIVYFRNQPLFHEQQLFWSRCSDGTLLGFLDG